MTRDDITRMAREAGFVGFDGDNGPLRRFAALVAAHALANIDPSKLMSYQEGYEAGRTAEREACANLCDEMERRAGGTECCKWPTPADCAYAIRARG